MSIVTPAPGVPGAVPFWKGDAVGRPRELGEAIGAFSRWAVDQDSATLERDYDLDELAAGNLIAFLREQEEATRVVPSERTIVIERFRDEIGDWRLCILSPYGGRVHAAWGLALSARIRDEYGLESDAIWSDDGIIVHLPDADEPPGAELVLIDPDELEDRVVGELGGSALFGARFRENAGRALLIPRAYPGRRTPLWQQRLKSQTLLEVAKRYAQFPIVLETYRECLRDVLDLPGTAGPAAQAALARAERGRGRDGDGVPVRLLAAVRLRRDLHVRGRPAQRGAPRGGARARSRAAARAARPGGAAGADRPRRAGSGRGGPAAALRAHARGVGRRPARRAAARGRADDGGGRDAGRPGLGSSAWLQQLVDERRAIALRIGGERRWAAAEDAGLFRDALGAVPPSGLPEAFLEDVPDAMERLVRRFARTHGPFETDALRARYGLDFTPVLQALERSGDLVRGELRPGGVQREWCDPEVLRRLRRASLAALRKEIEPADQRALARFLPNWQGVDRHPAAGAGPDRLREVLIGLQGLALPAEVWERDVLPRRVGAYSPSWMDALCAAGELVWVGAGALGRRSGRVALYFREDVRLLGPPPPPKEAPAGPVHGMIRERLAAGACFFTDLLADLAGVPSEELQEALWDLVWAGEVTNDAYAPLRSPRLSAPWSQSARADRARRRRFSSRRAGSQPQVQGRWSLVSSLFAAPEDPTARRRAQAELLLERYGIVTREQVLAEGIPGGFSSLYDQFAALETVGVARRGYFIEGLGGAQFALPGAVERLRAQRDDDSAPPIVLAATDPAQPYGAVLRWPQTRRLASPARHPGAYVVLAGAEPVIYVERGGKGLQILVEANDPRLGDATAALADAVHRGRIKRLAIERVDGEPIVGSEWEDALIELGFRPGPRKLTLSA